MKTVNEVTTPVVDAKPAKVAKPKAAKAKTSKIKDAIAKQHAKKATAKATGKATLKKTSTPREASKSGKFTSIRHLMEVLFAKKLDMTKAEACEAVKKEFPNAAFLVNPTAHFGWYKSHIVSHNEWKHVEQPKAKVKTAKIKKATATA